MKAQRGTEAFDELMEELENHVEEALHHADAHYQGLQSYAYRDDFLTTDEGEELVKRLLVEIEEIDWPDDGVPKFRLKGETKWRSTEDAEDFPQPSIEPADEDEDDAADNPGEPQGWRPYGPGKYDSIVSSHVHQLSLDGVDDEMGDAQDFGWYGIMKGTILEDVERIAREQGDELTEEEREELEDVVGVIVSEDSQGFVTVDYYEDEQKLDAAWKKLAQEHDEFYEGAEAEEAETEDAAD